MKNTNNVKTIQVIEGFPESKRKYSIEFNFDTEKISGHFVGSGLLNPISLEECIEVIDTLVKYGRPLEFDITDILANAKKELSIS